MELHYKDSARIDESVLKETARQLEPYRDYLNKILSREEYDAPECSVNLPIDQQMIPVVKVVKKSKVSKKLKYILVIGIGGSNLGTKAIYDAIYGFTDVIDHKRFPRLIFLETTDPEYLRRLKNFLGFEIKHPEEILLNIISKSGTTTETIANAEIIISALKEKFDLKAIEERIVITTDENSKLWNMAKEKNITSLPIPEVVGGRYSVFSPVGLFPIHAIGQDIESLCEGASTMRKNCIENEFDLNPALISATLLFLNAKAGGVPPGREKTINDNFFFAPQLESLGKWYRQLMGESIGKETDSEGNVVHAGITPTVSIGSTDLHSVGQLYLGGPLDKFTTFVSARNVEDPMPLPKEFAVSELTKSLENKSAKDIMEAILEGTKMAYSKKELPFMEIVMPDISPFALGEFLQFKMIEMMYLGKLMNVNTFDQPNVELYKIETRKILNETKSA